MSKRLVVCCDGTWNRPAQLEDGAPAPTNVSKLALAVAPEDPEGVRQLVFYQPGVGTRRWERLRGGAFGVGLSRNVRDCYRFLVENYDPGDELYLFGFSRGAFTARSTAGLVRNSGILRREHLARIKDAYRLYRGRGDTRHPNGIEALMFRRLYAHPDTKIKFVGVWDTVGSLGIPIDGVRLPLLTKLWSFHDTELSSRVCFAYQALAIDERRGPFKPTVWKQQDDVPDQTLEQLWFAGVHGDVGGGYAKPELAEIALLWMVSRAGQADLAFEPDHFERATPPVDVDRRALGRLVAPDALAPVHVSLKGYYLLLPRHQRRLCADGGALASTVRRRLREDPDYQPPTVAAYLSAGGRVVETG